LVVADRGCGVTDNDNKTVFTREDELRDVLGPPMDLAVRKAIPKLDKYCREFIQRSPFLCLGTANASGKADVSPRGDGPGVVQILDDNTLFLPERPGNSRFDTLTNIVENSNVGLLFFIPGYEDTLRVNGRASVVKDQPLLEQCAVNGKVPKVGIKIEVNEAFLHCAKALKRAKLWNPESHQDRGEMPSLGKMILEQTAPAGSPPTEQEITDTDEFVEENYRTGLY
jgi:PPOX class probable FMN-dependent enzyme